MAGRKKLRDSGSLQHSQHAQRKTVYIQHTATAASSNFSLDSRRSHTAHRVRGRRRRTSLFGYSLWAPWVNEGGRYKVEGLETWRVTRNCGSLLERRVNLIFKIPQLQHTFLISFLSFHSFFFSLSWLSPLLDRLRSLRWASSSSSSPAQPALCLTKNTTRT